MRRIKFIKNVWSSTITLLSIALILLGCTSQNALNPTISAEERPIEVLANTEWQNTGIKINKGDQITIQYVSGSWTTFIGYHSFVDGEGNVELEDPKNPDHPVPDAYPGVLIARIGNGSPRAVGNQADFQSCETGTLFLQMNDDMLSDNDGSIYVIISVQSSEEIVECSPNKIPTTMPDSVDSPFLNPNISTMTVDSRKSFSPDGMWKAEALLTFFVGETNSFDYTRLIVTKNLNGDLWWMPYEEWSDGGLGDSSISNFYWSPDGQYLFFTHRGFTHPCGYQFTTNLRRVELKTGSLIEIPLIGLPPIGDISISPDVKWMAHQTAEGFLIFDLENNSSRTLTYTWPEEFNKIADSFVWSPDHEELAFNLRDATCDETENTDSSLQIIDLKTGETRSPTSEDTWLYLTEKITLDPISTSAIVLQDFLNSLYQAKNENQGDYSYDRAAALFGGSYESLIEMNPEIDPGDQTSLLRNACEVNGYQCLRLREIISSYDIRGSDGSQIIVFRVRLMNPDSSVFTIGACCSERSGLPQTQFYFSVKQFSDGSFKVLELPPYLP